MPNLMSMKQVFNKTSRNGFDLSEKNIFSAKIGELLPCACIECIPGDSFKINTKNFTRTMPVNTAAYTRIREYYDWFFVPTNLLWNKFNTFVTQMGNNNQQSDSIIGATTLSDEHPYFLSDEVYSVLNSFKTSSKKNIFGFDRWKQSKKLLEYLDYGCHGLGDLLSPVNGTGSSLKMNAFPLLAYQKIYSDYYRNSQWEDAYAPAFNINYLSGGSSDSDRKIPIQDLFNNSYPYTMFDLHYANWNKDMFMGLLPNSQYGDAATAIVDDPISSSPYLYLRTYNSDSAGSVAINTGGYLATGVTDKWRLQTEEGGSTTISKLSILALRNAEALQKWSEITQSHQQDYQSQLEAHFGVKVSDAYSERCKYIGGNVSTIDISEVVNTNLADNNAPDIAGKGVGVGNGYIDFDTKVHGYLMCIYHAVPLLDYASYGIKKHNLKTKVTDYAIPEFDRTGMVQVSNLEMISPNLMGLNYTSPLLLGYAPRYYDYKTSVDRVRGAFVDGGLDSWVAPFSYAYIEQYYDNLREQGLPLELNYQFFKVNPATLNPIFVSQITTDNNGYDTDQLLINTAFDIKSVRNLDYNGLPY